MRIPLPALSYWPYCQAAGPGRGLGNIWGSSDHRGPLTPTLGMGALHRFIHPACAGSHLRGGTRKNWWESRPLETPLPPTRGKEQVLSLKWNLEKLLGGASLRRREHLRDGVGERESFLFNLWRPSQSHGVPAQACWVTRPSSLIT